jgi:DNA polymerase elongation subunit (family B)
MRRLNASVVDASDYIVDIREWDVPYHVRVMIDMGMELDKIFELLHANLNRYTNRKMVFGRGETWRYIFQMLRREAAARRSSRDGIRY